MRNEYIDHLIVFDLETTGCNPVQDYIIEIGAIKIKDGEIVSKYHQMVNPGIPIPYFITEITGITDDMVSDAPYISEALPSFLDFCDTDYILGHNISFDYRFIKSKCSSLGYTFNKKALDTLMIARKFLKHLPSRSLGPLCEYYGIDLRNAHRAIHDAEATYRLFQCLKKDFMDVDASAFIAKEITWDPPKQEMITPRQKKYLADLIRMHRLVVNEDIETLTKSEASRMIDKILVQVRSGQK
jgi:DNA polymerase-3 subunit alpha (Gram-positive type)